MNEKVDEASAALRDVYTTFGKNLVLPQPFYYETTMMLVCDGNHNEELYAPYWYHPDHLGSSSYITNLDGEINQHMEYLPFGELLVEEHLSSYNSPFKFNAKEFDAETGNYYYGARYYNPRWSIWLSVDPLAEFYPDWSPYNYVLYNPVKLTDSTGMCPDDECPDPVVYDKRKGIVLDEVVITAKRGATGNAQGAHVETTDRGERFNGFKAEGQTSGEFWGINGHISGFSVGYEGYTEPGGIHGSASIHGLHANAEGRVGIFGLAGEGSVFKAEIAGDLGLYTGRNGKVGVEIGGEAGAYALDGSFTPSISIFGVKIGVTIGGSAGSAHAGARGAAVYNNRTGEGELSGNAHFGFGVGFKIGFSIIKNNSGTEVNAQRDVDKKMKRK